MKKFLFLFAILAASNLSFAQGEWCGSMDQLNQYHEENPGQSAVFQQDAMKFIQNMKGLKRNKMTGNLIVPLVIHVVHYNGLGNVSKAQILDGLRIINEDFQKLNADTSAVRSVFEPHIADFGIEFQLAKIDPIGNPTEGIIRLSHHTTFPQSNRNSVKAASPVWDIFSYLNVWMVNGIGNNVLGFAQFPGPGGGGNSTYGLVVNANEWGSIELANGNDGRTVTHEIGHCFNLLHTFQGSCGSLCHATGDFVCDTPPQFDDNNNSCNFNLNTCSNDASGGIAQNPNPYTSNVPDQLENYMGYGLTCLGMFTEGQKTRVLGSIATIQKLDSITTAYNNIQTGTNPGYVGPTPKPIIDIHAFDYFVCEGGSVAFSEDSYGGPLTNYQWTFPGGSPATSTLANPVVTYSTRGSYDVSLKITNAGGADSVTLSNYVHVNPSVADYSAYNFNETFENPSSFLNEWVNIDEYVAPSFDIATFAAASGSNSLWINNRVSSNNTSDRVISPSLKMSDVINPSMAIDVSYRRRNASNADRLILWASIDCGETWISVLNMLPNFYAFDNGTTAGNWVPTSPSHWKTVNIPPVFIPAAVKNGDNVKFMIELEKQGGNNLFIDNFRVIGQPVGIEDQALNKSDFLLYPNPSSDRVNIKLNLLRPANTGKVYIQNILGKVVEEVFVGSFTALEYSFVVDTKKFAPGIYFITTELDGERLTRKLIVE